MVKIKLWKFILFAFQFFHSCRSFSHWIVTENGRIQAKVESPFYLRRPYDLFALIDQETRKNDINVLYKDLVNRKTVIDMKWTGLEGASDVETRVYTQDPDCLKAGTLLSEINLYTTIFTNGSHRGFSIELDNDSEDEIIDAVPECMKYSDVGYSMFTYEHLQPMIDRKNLSIPAIPVAEADAEVSVQFAEQIALALRKNSTSWIHYNLAAMYWRMEGEAFQAIECIRRALFYVPYQYRDIPLLTLAGIFHITKHSKEAALILHAAIDHAPYEPMNYLALGHVYTMLADYNRSVLCYDNVLKLKPDYQDVITVRHATLCRQKLENGLMSLHESLQDILMELHDYHSQQQQWLRLQERLIWEQAPIEMQLVGYSMDKIHDMFIKKGQRCIYRTSEDQKSTISCDFMDNHVATSMQFDIMNFRRLLRNVENEAKKINDQMAKNKANYPRGASRKEKDKIQSKKEAVKHLGKVKSKKEKRSSMPPLGNPVFPTSTSTLNNLYFDVTGWPGKDECLNWDLDIDQEDNLNLPVFLPPENKGYQVNKILSEYIDIPEEKDHDLPWYPPICKHPDMEEDESYLPSSIRRVIDKPLKSHPILQQQLLGYINQGNGEEAEIGQRIVSAMNKKSGPPWVLATLASLYWRIRSNTKNALSCLDLPFDTVPKEHTDVILVSMGSIFHQLGLIEDAIKFASLAFKVNYVEPSTNFLLALLHYTNNNPILAMYYMKNVLRVDPNYYEGKAEVLLKTWACRVKLGAYEDLKHPVEKPQEEMCKKADTISGEGVICSPNGDQCKTASIQCVRTSSLNDVEAHCTKHKVPVGQSLISLLASEGSGASLRPNEPEMTHLENIMSQPQQAFHMRITLGDEAASVNTLGDFYVSVSLTDDPVPEPMLYVYDKSGKYPLSHKACQHIRDADWLHFTSMWQSIAARNIDISPYLKPLHKSIKEHVKPRCSNTIPPSSATLDHLTAMVLRNRLPSVPETTLSEWLGLMAGDQHASIRELGTKISIALQENTTSWILATAAALYWRVVGNTEEAITCLRHALTYVPSDMKDVPLISLANILHKVGFHGDALEVAYIALESKPDFPVNHFTAGNIHTSLGDLEKAISFYRQALALDANFEPARNRLQAILCTFLFDETGSLRDITDISET
nr:tetratricopeptide repeat protein 17 [Onthophagus taurus]